MNVLAIDVGTYSIKCFESLLDKKKLQHVAIDEIFIQKIMEQHPEISTPEEAGLQGLIEIIQERAKPDTKIICHIPSHFVTTRFLSLPVKSPKKAELMIPFQLEEDIPFSLSDCHMAFKIEAQKSQCLALVAVTKQTEFEPYLEKFKELNIYPQVITTEPSPMDSYYFLHSVAGPFCVLDLGHNSSKGYFFYNSKLISTHFSYVAGSQINQAIAQNYQISLEEAQEYKHQKAFVLTTNQMNTVDPSQKDFAQLMDQIMNPLITDFARWELGFRVHYGLKIAQVFLIGGTSSLKNIAPYLSEKFGTKVSLLETFENVITDKTPLSPSEKPRFTLANMMVISLRAKNRLINLLTGKYAQSQSTDLPIHSWVFIASRASMISLLFVIFLVIESFSLKGDIKKVNSKINEVLKNPILALPKRFARQVTTQPKMVSDKLISMQKAVSQQISTLQSANQIEALSPLVKISAIAAGSSAILTELSVNETGEISGIFKAKEIKEIEFLQDKLKSSDLNSVNTKIEESKLTLQFSAVE